MIKTKKLTLFSLLLLLIGWSSWWFQGVLSPAVDPDEVVWVLDARYYQFRRDRQWQYFQLTSDSRGLGWSDEKYRLIDQPQMGKYIYGWLLTTAGIDPWSSAAQTKNWYLDFQRENLSLGNLEAVRQNHLPLATAISLLRWVGAVVSFIGILVFGWGSFWVTHSKTVGALTSSLLFFHPTLHHWYRLAVPNNFQLMFIISALSLFLFLTQHPVKGQSERGWLEKGWLKKDPRRFLTWGLLGALMAATASTKLNGLFLLAFPVIVWLAREIQQSIYAGPDVVVDWRHYAPQLLKFLMLGLGFGATFYFLEPALWSRPSYGLRSLLVARLAQHQRFLRAYVNYSPVETGWFLVIEFIKFIPWPALQVFWVLCLVWGLAVAVDYSLRVGGKWLSWTLCLVLLTLFSLYHANVGFERYAEWSLYGFSFFSSLGCVELIKQGRVSIPFVQNQS